MTTNTGVVRFVVIFVAHGKDREWMPATPRC
jgi:hypothetical protein